MSSCVSRMGIQLNHFHFCIKGYRVEIYMCTDYKYMDKQPSPLPKTPTTSPLSTKKLPSAFAHTRRRKASKVQNFVVAQLSPSSLHFHELTGVRQWPSSHPDLPMLNVKGYPRLDGLQLHSHTLGRQELRRYAERVQCTPGACFLLRRSVETVSHQEVLHRNEHRVRLFFGH